ncbi:hypothetical protein DRQ20_05595 [bacterium]|nr:MAG: hypothetical protein DRQ20_05595 [bacterium]
MMENKENRNLDMVPFWVYNNNRLKGMEAMMEGSGKVIYIPGSDIDSGSVWKHLKQRGSRIPECYTPVSKANIKAYLVYLEEGNMSASGDIYIRNADKNRANCYCCREE